MKLANAEFLKGNHFAQFSYYRNRELWYRLENGFLFPVPVDDTGMGTFPRSEKAIFFMRWVRKWEEQLRKDVPEFVKGAGDEKENKSDDQKKGASE